MNFSVVFKYLREFEKIFEIFFIPCLCVFKVGLHVRKKSVENRLSVSLFHCLHLCAKIGGYCGSTYFYECEKIALERR
jgi:hypothetical protein